MVLPLLESDLLTVMMATTNGTLKDTEVKFADRHACCVVMASEGYPGKYTTGHELKIPAAIADSVFVAGAKLDGETLVTAGGRVLGATAVADTLEKAIEAAYVNVKQISFANAFYRKDIGQRALKGENK